VEPERIFRQVQRRYARSIHLAFVFWQRVLSHDFRPMKKIRYFRPIKRKNRSKFGEVKQSDDQILERQREKFFFCSSEEIKIYFFSQGKDDEA
jgi:hypothetical protein